MWYITLNLNDKGKKICKANTRIIEINIDHYPTNIEVENAINEDFMSELVEEIISIKADYRYLNIGDIVKIISPDENHGDKVEFGEVTYTRDDSYAHEFAVTIHDIENYNPNYGWNTNARFNFAGTEIGGSRKNKRYVEIPTEEEIIRYNNGKNKSIIYNEVEELLHHFEDWEDIDDVNIPRFITVDNLVQIRDILNTAKNKYYNNN